MTARANGLKGTSECPHCLTSYVGQIGTPGCPQCYVIQGRDPLDEFCYTTYADQPTYDYLINAGVGFTGGPIDQRRFIGIAVVGARRSMLRLIDGHMRRLELILCDGKKRSMKQRRNRRRTLHKQFREDLYLALQHAHGLALGNLQERAQQAQVILLAHAQEAAAKDLHPAHQRSFVDQLHRQMCEALKIGAQYIQGTPSGRIP